MPTTKSLSSGSSNRSIWIYDEGGNSETYGQVFALQFDLIFLQNLKGSSALLKGPTTRKPSLVLVDCEKGDSQAENWLELFARPAPSVPIVVVQKCESLDHLRHLKRLGVAETIPKPLNSNELIYRCENVLANAMGEPFEILPNTIDRTSIRGLTFKERQLLAIFLLSAKRSVNRDDLFGAIWKSISVNRKTLDVHLFNLRRKLHPYGFDIVCRNQNYQLKKS